MVQVSVDHLPCELQGLSSNFSTVKEGRGGASLLGILSNNFLVLVVLGFAWQVLYHMSHAPDLFCLVIFWIRCDIF
jgi:hypothetical protein